jgi:hypothetical protein
MDASREISNGHIAGQEIRFPRLEKEHTHEMVERRAGTPGERRCYAGSPVTMWSRRADAPRPSRSITRLDALASR